MPLDVPLGHAAVLCAALIAATWLLSVWTREYSWVDRIWSLAPPVYAALYARDTGFSDPRLVLMTALAALWGARLTFNFARKGGYARGGEDYRWAVLRERLGPVAFQVFNATFISPYQNILILLFTLPVHTAWQHRGAPLGTADALFAAAFLGFLVMETVADQQQWRFHQEKWTRLTRGEAVDPPFLTTGLWRYSRHPNFFAEQAIWWSFYGLGMAASGSWLSWTLAGPILLSLLFQGSTAFTEWITAGRYPAYAAYQRRTSRLLPLPPRARKTQ